MADPPELHKLEILGAARYIATVVLGALAEPALL
jgi:hypothetical protein